MEMSEEEIIREFLTPSRIEEAMPEPGRHLRPIMYAFKNHLRVKYGYYIQANHPESQINYPLLDKIVDETLTPEQVTRINNTQNWQPKH
jgi:hypothetical protein